MLAMINDKNRAWLTMIGIVLWSDPNSCKAVFWCEDHGDLAYYSAEFDETKGCSAFAAGDMVQFDVFSDAEFRRAVNPKLVQENACSGLEKRLQTTAQKPGVAQQHGGHATVVQFRPAPANAQEPTRRSERR